MKMNFNLNQKIGLIIGVLCTLILLFVHNPFSGYYGCFDSVIVQSGPDFQPVNLESYKPWFECRSEGAFFVNMGLISTWLFAQALVVIFTLFWLWLFKKS